MSGEDAHDEAVRAMAPAAATDSLIYGKYAVGQIYSALPPAPEGFEIHPVSASGGESAGYRYVPEGTMMSRSTGRQGRLGAQVRINTYPSNQKGQNFSTMDFNAPVSQGTEELIFNQHGVPTLISQVTYGPPSVTHPKRSNPFFSTSAMLVAGAIASYNQARLVNDGDDAELWPIPDEVKDVCAAVEKYATGDRLNAYKKSILEDTKVLPGSDGAITKCQRIARFLAEGVTHGYNPSVIINQLKTHIALLQEHGLDVPAEVAGLLSD